MNPLFNDMLGEATRLTQGGNLQAATELIQRALRGEAAPASAGTAPATARAATGFVIDAETRVIDEPAAPAAGDAPAAPRAAPASATEQWRSGSFTHQGRQLAYKLYVPPTTTATTAPRPLVLMLHGCTQGPDDFAAGTRMNTLAREAGVLVLYPEQTQHANAQKCWNWFKSQHQQRGRGEPALLAGLTRQVMAEHDVDPARVYVAGLSAGGAMADIMGRTYPDLFAAVGVHSGLAAGAAADLPSALAAMRSGAPAGAASGPAVRPVIVFHGDADSTVNHANGAAVVNAARGAQQVTGTAQATQGQAPNRQRHTHTVHRAADGSPAIEYWQLHGGAHAWSGGSAAGSYTAPGGVDASAEMLRFFLSHRRPPTP
ncbi:PHB depolymerase family esterase [Pseudorhodoferax sp. Leaf267]|uniref:extracellular catalytic domain type 1 short-chain-length polyhydroxyalkanoate depolymerase n=1 Tax=Pseudorhodoferax sp. Leaf267 TaxID=1736316 RepID=UPI0006F6E873|nr:PHB depolymerase family esterase [Pseudorhodoferax sp. Leaf267]KQP18133.1 esterase [Pseudorhodoferax sp. Leaf267]